MLYGFLLVLAAFQSPAQSRDQISFTRLQEIAREAEELCPHSSNVIQGRAGAEWLAREADRRGYTVTEKSLLLNLCLFYSLGKAQGMR